MTDIIKILRFDDRPISDLAIDEIERLRAERDAAVKDAERWRWARTHDDLWNSGCSWAINLPEGADEIADAAIDAARSEAALQEMVRNAEELGLYDEFDAAARGEK